MTTLLYRIVGCQMTLCQMFVTIRILQKEVSLVNAPHTCIRYQSNGNQKKKASQLDLQIEIQGWYLEREYCFGEHGLCDCAQSWAHG